jgi:hypothetical protein
LRILLLLTVEYLVKHPQQNNLVLPTKMGLSGGNDSSAEDDQKMRKMSAGSALVERNSKYRGVYFGAILLCRDKCSKSKGEDRFVWHQSEVTAIDGESVIQLHYSGSPLKYDRWMSLQSDWKDLAPLRLLTKSQIENGDPLDNKQATMVYDYLLSGELAEIVMGNSTDSEMSNTFKPEVTDLMKQTSTSSISADSPTKGLELFVGKKIEVMDYFYTKPNEMKVKWRFAQVVDITTESIRIHFSGWDPKWDEDIDIKKAQERIRERRRKERSIDASTERASSTNCPHCGESLLHPPLEDFQSTPVASRRASVTGRYNRAPSVFFGEDHPAMREGQFDEWDAIGGQLPGVLTVDDRINIALKVADRRLSSIQSTRSLMGVSTSTEGSRDRLNAAMPPRVMARRGSCPPPEHSRITYDMYK